MTTTAQGVGKAPPARPTFTGTEAGSCSTPSTGARGSQAAVLHARARATTVVAVGTAAARIAGFLRVSVFGRVFGAGLLGDTYLAANTVPNVIYESVAGGALAGVMVPVLAGPAAARDTRALRQTVSALLTWATLVLTPAAVLCAVFSHQILDLLVAGDAPDRAARVHLGARMLVVFAPQIVLYGIGIVCTGVLQAHHRFLAPAVAPLVSSLVVITTYLVFAYRHPLLTVGEVSAADALVLSVGTTLGVVALTATVALPTLRLRLGLRTALRFPAGVAASVRRLALAGAGGLLAQQASLLVALRLASRQQGAQTLFLQATAVFLVPWAVLAVPVATTAFPAMSAAMSATKSAATSATKSAEISAEISAAGSPEISPATSTARFTGDGDAAGFDRILSGALVTVLFSGLIAAGLLVALAGPVARVVMAVKAGTNLSGVRDLQSAVVAFAPGLPGFAVLAVTMRALYARGATRRAAAAVVAGWGVVIVTDVALVAAFPTVPAATLLGAGNSAGMTVAAVLLVGALVSVGARADVGRIGRALGSGGLAGAAAALGGLVVTEWTRTDSLLVSFAATGGAALIAAGTSVALVERARLPVGVRRVVR